MRRIQRLRQPSAVITQCLQATASTPQPTAVCRAATSCLSRRPRDFSTTPNRPFNRTRTWADKPKTEPVVEKEIFEAPVGAEAEAQAARRRERLSRRTAKAARAEDEFLEPEETKSPSSEQEADPFAAIIAEPSTSESKISLMTDLVLPPTDLTVAPRPSDLDVDADADAEAYKPASTADGLEVIGGLQGWFDPAAEPEKDHWGPSKRFVPFAPVENKVTEPVLLELCAVRAVLEAVALDTYLNERGLGDGPKTLLADTWRNDGIQGFNRVLGMECVIKEDGKVQLGKNWETVARALEADPEAEAAVKDLMPPVQEAAEIAKTWVPGWKKISLQDAKLKFAVRPPLIPIHIDNNLVADKLGQIYRLRSAPTS